MKKILIMMLLSTAGISQAQLPHTFESGGTISAAEINANFAYLNNQIESQRSDSAILHSHGMLSTMPQALIDNTDGNQSYEVLFVYSAAGAFLTLDCSGQTIRFGSGTAAQGRVNGLFVPPGCSLMGYTSANSSAYTYILSYAAR